MNLLKKVLAATPYGQGNWRYLLIGFVTFLLAGPPTMAQTKDPWPSSDEKVPSYTLVPPEKDLRVYYAPADDEKLGPVQEVEVYDTEHHLYRVPFRYKNVKLDRWLEFDAKGVEILAERGSITIIEDKPIVAVTVVGSGCSTPSYNVVEWWSDGEDLQNAPGQLIKRERVDNLKGQHPAWIQAALSQKTKFKTLEEANAFRERLRDTTYAMTNGFTVPGSLMGGLYENTAYFRVGDAAYVDQATKSWRQVDCHKVVIRGGGQDYEDPGKKIARYPADYTFRLIDVVVKKAR